MSAAITNPLLPTIHDIERLWRNWRQRCQDNNHTAHRTGISVICFQADRLAGFSNQYDFFEFCYDASGRCVSQMIDWQTRSVILENLNYDLYTMPKD